MAVNEIVLVEGRAVGIDKRDRECSAPALVNAVSGRHVKAADVINDVSSFDVAATYGINERWSATLSVPFIDADRSSLYEHDFIHRHTMYASGLGDIRLVSDVWLLD